jgi:hypothetical protein
VIQRFRHKGLERLFTRGDASGVTPHLAAKLRRMLILLDNGKSPAALDRPVIACTSFVVTVLANGRHGCPGTGGWCSNSRADTPRRSSWLIITEDIER